MLERTTTIDRVEFILKHLNDNVDVVVNVKDMYVKIGSIKYNIKYTVFNKESVQSRLIKLYNETKKNNNETFKVYFCDIIYFR